MLRNYITIIIAVGSLFLALNLLSCEKKESINKESNGNNVSSTLQTPSSEWSKCKNRQVSSGSLVKWKIKVTSVGFLGGIYGKGYLDENKSCLVQLRWGTETEFYKSRKPNISGKVILINGTFWGTSENGEVIIDVKDMEIVTK